MLDFPIWVWIGLAILALLFVLARIASLYRKAGPNEALLVYGLGKTKIVNGGGTIDRKSVV